MTKHHADPAGGPMGFVVAIRRATSASIIRLASPVGIATRALSTLLKAPALRPASSIAGRFSKNVSTKTPADTTASQSVTNAACGSWSCMSYGGRFWFVGSDGSVIDVTPGESAAQGDAPYGGAQAQ